MDNVAYAYIRAGENARALEFMDSHPEKTASYFDLLHSRAIALDNLDRTDESLQSWLDAMKLKPEDHALLASFLDFAERRDLHRQALDYLAADPALASRPPITRIRKATLIQQAETLEKGLAYLDTLQGGDIDPDDVAIRRMRMYYDDGQYRQVIVLTDAYDDTHPRFPDVLYWRGLSQWELEWYREALGTYQRILNIRPNDRNAANSLQRLSALIGRGDNTDSLAAIEPVPLPDWLPPPSTDEDLGVDSDFIFLERSLAIHFKPGEPRRQTLRIKILLKDPSAVESYSTLRYHFRHHSERVHINRLQVLEPDGSVIASANPDSYYILDNRDTDMAVYERTLHAPVPGLRPGTVLDIEVTWGTIQPASELRYEDFDFRLYEPSRRTAVVLHSDSAHFRARTYHDIMHESRDGVHAWFMIPVRERKYENGVPDYSLAHPNLRLAHRKESWEQVAEEYRARIRERLEPGPELAEHTRAIVGDLADPEEILTALCRFAHSEITYKAIEFGSRGVIPETASTTYKNRYGDCKDMAVMLHGMLRTLGIDSQLVLVNSRDIAATDIPTLDQFDHMILRVSMPDGPRFVDLTDRDQAVARLPSYTWVGREVLVLDADGAKWETVPPPRGPALIQIERRLFPVPGNKLEVRETLRLTGYPAGWVRRSFRETRREYWNQELRSFFRSGGENAEVSELSITGVDDSHADLLISSTYTVHQIAAEVNEGLISFQIPIPWERYYLNISQTTQRVHPYVLRYPLRISSRIICDEWAPAANKTLPTPDEPVPGLAWSYENAEHPALGWTLDWSPGVWQPDGFHRLDAALTSFLAGCQGRALWTAKTNPEPEQPPDQPAISSGEF